jgi:hypothetical protein
MIKIYKNNGANAIFMEDDNGAQFLNSIQAVILDPLSTKVSIYDNVKDIYLVWEEDHTEFVDENGLSWGSDAQSTCNAMNSIFMNSGTPTGDLPQITSPLSVDIVAGSTLNYELTSSFGVGYEWDLSNVSGVTTVDGNVRKLIGGSSLNTGSYNIPVKAINYNGEDSQTLVLNVTAPPFANTISTEFNNNDWLGGNAGILQNVLGRTGNGSGASDAWSISFWFKAGTSNNNFQTILYFGDGDLANGGHIYIRFIGISNKIQFRYGTNNNMLFWDSANNSIPSNTWKHITITYNGGTTGSSSGNVNNYYSRFKIFIDGNNAVSSGSWGNSNYGYTGSIDPDNFRIGRYSNGNYMRNGCKVDELAIWDSDQSSNVNLIYNSGTPANLGNLTNPPLHWWRMGDGDTYPFISDVGTQASLIFIMYSMSLNSFVNDTP